MNSLMYSSTMGRRPVIAAPTAAPISAVSEMGVMRTRFLPNFFRNGSRSVMAMFWPKKMTLESRCISSAMAVAIASANIISRATVLLLCVNVLHGVLGGGERAGQSKLHGVFHLRPRGVFDVLGAGLGKRSVC